MPNLSCSIRTSNISRTPSRRSKPTVIAAVKYSKPPSSPAEGERLGKVWRAATTRCGSTEADEDSCNDDYKASKCPSLSHPRALRTEEGRQKKCIALGSELTPARIVSVGFTPTLYCNMLRTLPHFVLRSAE